VSPESDRFQTGMLFEWAVDLGDIRIEVLAEVVVLEQVLHLRDIAIFPTGTGQAAVGAAALLRALRRELIPQIRAEGFRRLRVTGTRLSGARPGRTLDITIDLTEDPT
jgi:hypothetical protein